MTDAEILPFQGPEKGLCECADNCGAFGTLKRPWADGSRCVARQCKCRRCMGKANKRKGQSKQRKAAKAVGIVVNRTGAGHEENYGGSLRIEAKSGAQVGPIHTRYLNARAQSEAARPIGDHRPFAFMAMPDGCSYGLLVVRTDELPEVVQALLENWNGGGVA